MYIIDMSLTTFVREFSYLPHHKLPLLGDGRLDYVIRCYKSEQSDSLNQTIEREIICLKN